MRFMHARPSSNFKTIYSTPFCILTALINTPSSGQEGTKQVVHDLNIMAQD